MWKSKFLVTLALLWAIVWITIATSVASASDYVTFSGGTMTVTQEGTDAGMDAVQAGIAMAFGILAFLWIYALALWGKFVLAFVMWLPSKVFGWGWGWK